MERYSDGAIDIINELHTERLDYTSEYMPLIDAAMRLSDYEDTGLDPHEILNASDMAKIACALHELNRYKELGDINRLQEALQKQAEYEEFMTRWKDAVALAGAVKDVGADRAAKLVEAYNLIGKKIYITKWPFKGRFIKDDPTERTIHHILVTKIEILLKFKDGAIPMSFLGKTAFLDRKEAKAALEKTKEANP